MDRLGPLVMLMACLFIGNLCHSQENENFPDKVLSYPTRLLHHVSKNAAALESSITRQTERYLEKLKKEEQRLMRRVRRKDSLLAKEMDQDVEQRYADFQLQIKKANSGLISHKEYFPFLDTLTTSLQYLEKLNVFADKKSLQHAFDKIKGMQSRFEETERVKQYLRNRKQYLRTKLGSLNSTKMMQKYSKTAWYYEAQINEYKGLLKEPGKLERKVIDLLSQCNPFKEFMSKHSIVGALFPGSNDILVGQGDIAGLQTGVQVNNLVRQMISGGPNNLQALQSNVQQAQTQIKQLKDRIGALGQSEGDIAMPDFRPNNQRTKSFWRRLECGTNLQTAKNNFFPTTTDLGLSVGYKVTDRSVVGVGVSYKMGWGKDIKHITFSHQGMGLRSFLDIKLKGSFFASGGLEFNHQALKEDSLTNTGVSNWNKISAWQKSGLIGLSKVVSIKSKFFKKTKLQIFWDFLSYQQIPQTQPIKFRIGYNF